jgi:hypothetical protein
MTARLFILLNSFFFLKYTSARLLIISFQLYFLYMWLLIAMGKGEKKELFKEFIKPSSIILFSNEYSELNSKKEGKPSKHCFAHLALR